MEGEEEADRAAEGLQAEGPQAVVLVQVAIPAGPTVTADSLGGTAAHLQAPDPIRRGR